MYKKSYEAMKALLMSEGYHQVKSVYHSNGHFDNTVCSISVRNDSDNYYLFHISENNYTMLQTWSKEGCSICGSMDFNEGPWIYYPLHEIFCSKECFDKHIEILLERSKTWK